LRCAGDPVDGMPPPAAAEGPGACKRSSTMQRIMREKLKTDGIACRWRGVLRPDALSRLRIAAADGGTRRAATAPVGNG
jgi:hypothetical protein